MKILILGGDGFLGWPTAMHLSNKGHEVMVVDNYLRRNLARELNVEPLFDNPNLHKRVKIWKKVSGKEIKIEIGDCADYAFISKIVKDFRPEGIVHYAEQPSAPCSMIDQSNAEMTLSNNLRTTLNLVYAVKNFAPDAHIVKIGTMGEYGTPKIDIEEGWIDIEHKGKRDRFIFPRAAGSLYHTTKIMDTDMLWFYVRVWKIRVTDLMQGPVYGIHTPETEMDERLYPNFNYDEIFGTVVNRFVVQAVAGHPLTIYGKGGQTRGYLNINDTMQCIELSLSNPARPGELRIFNQLTETLSVNKIAEQVKRVGDKLGLNVEIRHVENPRKEAEEHYYNPAHTGLRELGLQPHFLTDEVMEKLLKSIIPYKDKIDTSKFMPKIKWE